jgi:N-acetylglutamate synthase-like GNAT family acetyltransferase
MLSVFSSHPPELAAPLGVRTATAADRDAVAAFLAEEGLPTQGIITRGTAWLIAERAGWMVGVAGVEFGPTGAALLRAIAVSRTARQQGLARRLAEAAIEEAHRRACDRMYALGTTGGAALERLGFRGVSVDEVQAALPETALLRLYHHYGVPPGTQAWRIEL